MVDRDHWDGTWKELSLIPPDPHVLQELLDAYAESGRAYHIFDHLRECFTAFDTARESAERPAEVDLAIWFHDAVYDTRLSDNELRSADWARRVLLESEATAECADRVHDLILATRHDHVPAGIDAALLVDVDLSILGADPDRYKEYDRQIRTEYSWVAPDDYRVGRAKVLRGFLSRATIYTTAPFVHLESRARLNLSNSLDALNA